MAPSPPPADEASLIERLARYLATRGGADWPACIEDAASLLAILKDPDPAMCAAGDAATWRAMVDAALTHRWTIQATPPSVPLDGGSDEEGDVALPDNNHGTRDQASWVQMPKHKGEG